MHWTPTRLLLTPTLTQAFRLSRPWTLTKNWCDVVKEPAWPFAYQKWEGSLWERKGRTNQDLQDMRRVISDGTLQEDIAAPILSLCSKLYQVGYATE